MKPGTAAKIIGKDLRTIERWIDQGVLAGGRPPVPGSHRWVDARHAVEIAIAAGRAHLIPEEWYFAVPDRLRDRLPKRRRPKVTQGHLPAQTGGAHDAAAGVEQAPGATNLP